MSIKQELLTHCHQFVEKKLNTIEESIQSYKQALLSETKSSAGDKHETGRALLQLEMEKAGQQFTEAQQMKEQLDRVDLDIISPKVKLGSIVETNLGHYFIAISLGRIELNNESYFVISSQSPIGKLLIGKEANDFVAFRDQSIQILQIL